MQPPSPVTPEWHARHAAANPPTLEALQEELAAPSWRLADGRWHHSVTCPAPPCTIVARYCYVASCVALPGDAAGPALPTLAAPERDFRLRFAHSVEGSQPAWISPPKGRKIPRRRRSRKGGRPAPAPAPVE